MCKLVILRVKSGNPTEVLLGVLGGPQQKDERFINSVMKSVYLVMSFTQRNLIKWEVMVSFMSLLGRKKNKKTLEPLIPS